MLTLVNRTPASQFLRVFFLSAAREVHKPQAWKVTFSQWRVLENVVRPGEHSCFARVNVLVSLQHSDCQENCHECSNHENGGGGVFFKKKLCLLVSEGLRAWVWIAEEDM